MTRWINPRNDDAPPKNKVVEGRFDDPCGTLGSVTHDCVCGPGGSWRLVDPIETREVRTPDAWRYKAETELGARR
jgi:hypothetical protein